MANKPIGDKARNEKKSSGNQDGTKDVGDQKDQERRASEQKTTKDKDDFMDDDSDDETNNQIISTESKTKVKNKFAQAKFHTKIAAVKFIQRIIAKCSASSIQIHFDLKSARGKRDQEYLVLYLQELIRVACITATSSFDELKISGLDLLQDIIFYFRTTKDPEFDDQLLLEQYQAQIDAALKPQFSPDTSAYVVSKACQVCSSWINSGVARTINDLHRVNFLLVSSLQKLNSNRSTEKNDKNTDTQTNSFLKFQYSKMDNQNQSIYSELSITIEKISVISAWAEVSQQYGTWPSRFFIENFLKTTVCSKVYIGAIKKLQSTSSRNDESLLKLVEPYLVILADYWYLVTLDYAFLSLPNGKKPFKYLPDELVMCCLTKPIFFF